MELVPLHGADLIEMIHSRGINARYLGLIRSLSNNDRIRRLVATEMMSRAATTLLREYMRTAASENALRGIVCQKLNLLLGTSSSAEMFWSLFMRLQLLGKFASANVTLWTKEEQIFYLKFGSKIGLLWEILSKTGIVLSPQAIQNANYELPMPFTPSDIISISTTVKPLVSHGTLLNIINQTIPYSRLDSFDQKLKVIQSRLEILLRLFGEKSCAVAAVHLQAAVVFVEQKNYNRAFDALLETVKCTLFVSFPIELSVTTLYIIGQVCLHFTFTFTFLFYFSFSFGFLFFFFLSLFIFHFFCIFSAFLLSFFFFLFSFFIFFAFFLLFCFLLSFFFFDLV
jgi:hypothetical protein